jgi:lipoprotein-anchoring transpeptidase ErfK/SrfK
MRSRTGGAAYCLALALLLGLMTTPAAQAQPSALYFPSTGHHLTDTQGFLSFWRAHDGERLLGFAVTESFEADGRAVQYFVKGRLELEADTATAASHVQTGRVAAEYAEALFRVFPPAPPRRGMPGEQVFPETGHMLRSPFLDFWQANGGQEFFGAPISEATWELTERGQRQVQYFERARLEHEPSMAGAPDSIQVGDLGRALALLRGMDTAPIPNWGAEPYGPSAPAAPDTAPLATPAPPPTARPPAPPPTAAPPARPAPARATPAPQAPRPQAPKGGDKHIVVNLSAQWLYAFEGGRQIFDAPVSTGRDGMNTPTGNYAIYAKLKIQTMSGETDGVPWVVPNVPNVMYINGGVALHGTYWHHRFGTGARLSHGCVNLPLDAAAWLFDWAPLGTPVRVTY